MPRKTLALIIGLVLVTIILFIIALRTGDQQAKNQIMQPKPTMQPSPTPVAHTILTLSPNPVEVVVGKQGSVDVMLDTSDNKVQGVQLELAYDPLIISNVKITPFSNAAVLTNKIDVQKGTITYSFGIQPNQPPMNSKGIAATIYFTAKNVPGKQTQISVLPKTKVSARGIAESVLKASNGTVINVVTSTSSATLAPVQ